MALYWNWSEKCGEIEAVQMRPGEEDQKFTLSLYKGNAFLIMTHEYKDEKTGEDMYNMFSFFTSKDHAKNCLGIAKGKTKVNDTGNIFDTPHQKFTKLRLNKKKHPYWKDVVAMFAEAFDNITIDVFSEEEAA